MELIRAIRAEWVKAVLSRPFGIVLIPLLLISLFFVMVADFNEDRFSHDFVFGVTTFVSILFLQAAHGYDLIAIALAVVSVAKEIRDGTVSMNLAGLSRRWTLYAAKLIALSSVLAVLVAAQILVSLLAWILFRGPVPLASRPDVLLKLAGLNLSLVLPGAVLVLAAVMLIGQFTSPTGTALGGIGFVGLLQLLHLVPVLEAFLPVDPAGVLYGPEDPHTTGYFLTFLYIAIFVAAGLAAWSRRQLPG